MSAASAASVARCDATSPSLSETKASAVPTTDTEKPSPFETLSEDLSAFLQERFVDLDADMAKVVARDMQGVLSRHGISQDPSENGTRRDEDDFDFRVIRVAEEYREPLKLDSRDTVARACCGERFANKVFATAKKLRIVNLILWVTGVLISTLGICGALPYHFSLAMLATIPAQTFVYLLMSRPLLWRLLGEWETWYLSFLGTTSAIALMDVFQWDTTAALYFTAFMYNNGVLFLNDAQLPAKAGRAVILVGYSSALVAYCAFIIVSQLGIMPNTKPRQIRVSVGSLDVKLDTLLFANMRLVTMSFFFVKNIYLKLRHPDAFAVIKARISTLRTSARAILEEQPRARRYSQMVAFGTDSVLLSKTGSTIASILKKGSILRSSSSRAVLPESKG